MSGEPRDWEQLGSCSGWALLPEVPAPSALDKVFPGGWALRAGAPGTLREGLHSLPSLVLRSPELAGG